MWTHKRSHDCCTVFIQAARRRRAVYFIRGAQESDSKEKLSNNKNAEKDDTNGTASKSTSGTSTSNVDEETSKRSMLSFAIPALGIYLSNPLLSNIDNAFVGQTVGTKGLAALSPATICTDQMLYLFSFLSRATTGLVSRAYGSTSSSKNKSDSDDGGGNTVAAKEAASAP